MSQADIISRIISSWRVYLGFVTAGLSIAVGYWHFTPPAWEVHAFYKLGSSQGAAFLDTKLLVRYIRSEQFMSPIANELGVTDVGELARLRAALRTRVISESAIEITAKGSEVTKLEKLVTLITQKLLVQDLKSMEEQLSGGGWMLCESQHERPPGKKKLQGVTDKNIECKPYLPTSYRRPQILGPALVSSQSSASPKLLVTALAGLFAGAALASVFVFLRR